MRFSILSLSERKETCLLVLMEKDIGTDLAEKELGISGRIVDWKTYLRDLQIAR